MARSLNVDWNAIRDEYANNALLIHEDLATKYSINLLTIQARSRREHWQEERQRAQERLRQRITEASIPKDALARVLDCNEKQLKWNEEMRWIVNSRLKYRDAEGKIVVKESVTLNDAYRATVTMAELFKLDRLALGASTDNIQPALTRDRFAEMSTQELVDELTRVRSIPIEVWQKPLVVQ